MKLPYKTGDIFAVPLGDGRTARALIVACEHRVVVLRVLDANEGTIATLRVSDDAIVLQRWKCFGQGAVALPVTAENRAWMHAAELERIAASRLGVVLPLRPRARVLEVRDSAVPHPHEIDGDTTLTWSMPLAAATLGRIGDVIAATPLLRVRVSSAAVSQIAHLATWPLTRLAIADECERVPVMQHVRELDLFASVPLQSFPRVEKLRVYGRHAFDLRELMTLPHLRQVELNGVEVGHPTRLLNCPELRTLRLSRTTGVRGARDVALPQLQTLELNHVGELAEISAIGEMPMVEQMQLRGFWQHTIAEMEWLLAMRTLKRVSVDIGGRRKNVELYRRATWAYPWPL